MVKFIRAVFLVASAAGGVYGAFKGLEMMALKASGTRPDLFANGEATLLIIPIAAVGALGGLFLGALVFPAQRR